MDEIKPWDRHPREGSKAYEHFQTYLDMGSDRTLVKVARQSGKSLAYINKLSADNGWLDRARSWDSMPRRAVVRAYEEMAADIAAQHERLATKLTSRLERNLDLLPEGTDPSIKWSTAHGAARQGHAFASDLSKPRDAAREEISKQIAALIERLAGGDE